MPATPYTRNTPAYPAEGWITLATDDGHTLDAFQVVPTAPKGSVVVLQEIFGVNPHIQHVARQLAALGYAAIAPAMFDRLQKKVSLPYDKTGIEQGKTLMGGMSLDVAMHDVAAAVKHSAPFGAVAVLGFCWGGSLAWLAAGRLPVAGAIAYYGGQIGALLDHAPNRPMLTHFGELDASIPKEVAGAVTERFGTVVNHLYPAGHGFNCDERASFDKASSALAWRRTNGFLDAII
ncbi:MAG: dienelactone hydrolase family protein [Polaromonas sp.]|uniref:dienelactone hydrolase family protein n=1 Tax=Polaromonas sp. TaxID=1869339 RepID=UPI0025F0F467|nr:dienelactone hydrolase family protein [Polaromonas sp.]MBI2725367.1 dienelactone hydrolase family protein [Polaromonas sp.]